MLWPKKILGEHLTFTNDLNDQIKFVYSDTTGNLFLRQLREEYNLLELIKDCPTDLKKLFEIVNWTSKQWKHSGQNTPSANDALTILKEASEGKRFRCVEYGIVLCSALNSIGLKARVLALKTKTVETEKYGAGHVLTEVFLQDFGKWTIADGQFNLVPFSNGKPLNAIEFQDVIVTGKEIKLCNLNGLVSQKLKNKYLNFVPRYLYYFDVPFDNRQGTVSNKIKIKDKTRLMLVPYGSKNPEIFQINEKIDYCIYTNSIRDFYKIP
jgi:hypothetical protein